MSFFKKDTSDALLKKDPSDQELNKVYAQEFSAEGGEGDNAYQRFGINDSQVS